jgi:hypothetical protein
LLGDIQGLRTGGQVAAYNVSVADRNCTTSDGSSH